MGIKVKDLDKTEAWKGGSMLPVGVHEVTVEEATEGVSNNGNDEIKLKFVDLTGIGDILDWLQFTEKTQGKQRQLLDATGIEAPSGEADFPTEQLVGKRLSIVVTEERDRQGATNEDGTPKMRRRVAAYRPKGSAPADSNGSSDAPVDSSDLPF